MSFWRKLVGVKESPKADTAKKESTQPSPASIPQSPPIQSAIATPPAPKPSKAYSILDTAEHGDLEKVKGLIEEDPSLVFRADFDGRTALHWAASMGHKNVAELLLSNKADVNAKSRYGMPLHYAASKGHQNVAELLLANKADVNAKDKDGQTPLHEAAEKGQRELAALLLASNAEINAKDKNGGTPLHAAASSGHKEVVELLLAKGARINARLDCGRTPLHCAALYDKRDVAELLLTNRAEVNTEDQWSRTPLTDATKNGFTYMADLLRQRGLSQDGAVSLTLRSSDNEGDDGKRRIQGEISSLNSLDTLRQISLDRSWPISRRVLAIKRGAQIGGDEWATFLTEHFVMGRNYGELVARATPSGDGESGEALTLLGESAWALKALGYEIEGIEVLSPTKLSMQKGRTISVVRKTEQKQTPIPKGDQREPRPDNNLVEQAKRLEEIIKVYSGPRISDQAIS